MVARSLDRPDRRTYALARASRYCPGSFVHFDGLSIIFKCVICHPRDCKEGLKTEH